MKVVLAHGTWDLLHAGHVAHLEQARAMGDWLVVGITDDAYVHKGPGRPSVAAQDRCHAVAALRCVDLAVIDPHPTPEKLIERWTPAIFVKGADYAGQPLPEQAWVARYGGEVRFTNGDTMYHSRQWLTGDARAQMAQQGVQVADLLAVLDQAAAYRIHVVGDVIVDEVAAGELVGPLTLRVDQRQRWLGGAAAVALHAAAAGAQARLTYPRGVGFLADWAKRTLTASTVGTREVVVPRRPPCKARYYGQDGLLCQIDTVDSTPLTPIATGVFAAGVRKIPTDAVIFADYRHGVFHADSIEALTAAIPAGALKVADSQVASRWGNITDFTDFDLVTPNEREARWATGMQDAPAAYVAAALQDRAGFAQVILTRGAEGLVAVTQDDARYEVPALASTAVDPVGAGDALLAYATLGLLASGRIVTAAWLGSVAAAIACSRRGNAPVTAAEVRAWLERL